MPVKTHEVERGAHQAEEVRRLSKVESISVAHRPIMLKELNEERGSWDKVILKLQYELE